MSVIVPMYAVETYLPDTIASLRNQSFTDIQIVLVDDDSPDDVATIAQQAAQHDPRVVYVHQANRGPGPGGGRNGGLAAATGDYLMFVDADDVIVPDAIEKMVAAATKADADLVTCNAARLVGGALHHSEFHDLGHRDDVEKTTAEQSPWLMYDSTPWNKLFRREFFDRVVGEWPEQILYEDIAVMTRAHLRSESTAVISEPLYYWRVRGAGQITQKTSAIAGDREQLRELGNGLAEIAQWGNPELLDWFSWKAFGFDLTWMTRKLARIAPAEAKRLAGDMQLVLDQLSGASFDRLPTRTRQGFGLVDRIEKRSARAQLIATNWRLTPVNRGFDVIVENPTADLVRWRLHKQEIEIAVRLDAAAHDDWQLELGDRPLLLAPASLPLAVVDGERRPTSRGNVPRRDRHEIVFRLPADLHPLIGELDVVHLAVASTSGTRRGEIGRSFRDRVAGRLGRGRSAVGDHSSAVPFFDNNRLMLAAIAQDTGVVSVTMHPERMVFSIDDELAASIDSVGLFSERRHEPFALEHDGGTSWSIAAKTILTAFDAGHQLLGLAAGLRSSPSVPMPLRGQPLVEATSGGAQIFLGGYAQVFLRPDQSVLTQAKPLLQYLKPRRASGI